MIDKQHDKAKRLFAKSVFILWVSDVRKFSLSAAKAVEGIRRIEFQYLNEISQRIWAAFKWNWRTLAVTVCQLEGSKGAAGTVIQGD
jgi:hypothetical protein